MEINALFAVALILLLALLAGRLAKLIHIPEVTGYLVAGLALGPSGVNLISEQTLTALNFLSEIAIGLILFSIGSVFEFANLQRVGKRVISLVAFEALGAGVLVVAGMLLVGATPASALLLGAMAMATAPASTILVLREYDAAGRSADRYLDGGRRPQQHPCPSGIWPGYYAARHGAQHQRDHSGRRPGDRGLQPGVDVVGFGRARLSDCTAADGLE